jgi:hypothetical protein
MKPSWISFFKPPVLAVTCFLCAEQVLAAACCGGGVAAPNIISGDDRAQVAASASSSRIVSDVYSDGLWREREANETSQTLRFDGAYMLADRWQMGASVPVTTRTREATRSSGLGDVSINAAYEFLPEWDYNPYRPKGIGYLQLTAPTGKTVFEDTTGVEARGRGFWSVGVGTLLTKSHGAWDGLVALDIHRSFEKRVNSANFNGTLQPGFGANMTLGGGYNLRSWRFGLNLAWFYEDPIGVEGTSSSAGTLQRYASASAAVSYLASDEWSATLSAADQSLLGSPLNTSLGRSVSLLVVRRWPL